MNKLVNTVVDTYNNRLGDYLNQESAAVEFLSAAGNLLYQKSIELVLFRNPLLDVSVTEVLNLHDYAKKVVNKPIDVYTSAELASVMLKMDLAPAKVDIGRLANEWLHEGDNYPSKLEFLYSKLSNLMNAKQEPITPKDVVLYGFGRIGRLVARELIRQAGRGQQLRIRAIVTRGKNTAEELTKRAALLRMDSVHGPFHGTVDIDVENQAIIANGQIIKMIVADAPENIDYTEYGIQDALLIDNTGAWRDRDGLSRHLNSKGVAKVLLTAPGKGDIPNIVYGVNQETLELDEETIFSAASCTTNAIVPILKTIDDGLGIVKGHIETVHAYTNDQNLLDNYHKGSRRGRSAAVNMVITETGAGKAAAKALPSLAGKFTSNAVRVPTPNGSLAILQLELNKSTTLDEVKALVRRAALEGDLVNQIYYSIEEELVSSDIIGNTCCSVFDSPATIVSGDGKSVVLYVWYDNEFGYTKQVIRLAKYIAKVRRLIYY